MKTISFQNSLRVFSGFCGLLLSSITGIATAATFTPGNLVIHRTDNGGAALSSAAATAFLDEYTPAGVYVQTIALPSTSASSGNRAVCPSGSASSEGDLVLSPDGAYLACVGYNATAGAASVAASTNNGGGSDVNRVIARIDSNGVVDSTTVLVGSAGTPLYTANNIRSAVISGSKVYHCGAAAPFCGYSAFQSTTAVTIGATATTRAVRVFNGDVYFVGSGTCSKVSGLPVASSTVTAFTFSGTAVTSPGGFVFLDVGNTGSLNVAYFVDGTTLRKYQVAGTTLTASGTATLATGSGVGLTASVSGSTVTVYTTALSAGVSSIQKTIDASGAAGSLAATPSTVTLTGNPVSANFSFRGIAFAPSASLSAPLFTTQPSSQSISSGTTATMSVATSGNPAATYQWYAGISGDTSSPISGATGSSYTTPALTATTSYWVRATNSQGTADSNTATITVTQAPAITTQLVNQTIVSGGAVTLSVVATGIPSPTYQWYEGAAGVTTSPVSGATSASFTSAALSAGTSFWVRATNASGSADSSAAAVTVVSASPISGTNRNILIPNTGSWSTGGVTLNGSTFINLGLQGVGRIPASAKDAVTGESLGSISDMQVTAWKKNVDGSYSGTFHFLPDRGYNSGVIFSNYAARINTFDFTFTPYTAAGSTTAQDQIAMTFTGSTRFTYNNGSANIFTTGTLANGSATLFGTLNPITTGASTQSDGTYSNRLTADTEGLVLDRRPGKSGQGWIGDEYGASIYHFNASKQIDGQVILPPVYVPHSPVGTTNFAGTPTNGRRDNQGMEGLAQSPDGTKLFGLMQSALVHDSLTGNQGRFNTRLLVYDISSTDTPSDPIAQYVIQLPVADDTGSTTNGTTVNRNCAQSSILALNDHQILILARDGNGRGASGTPVFKSILLADLNGATNIDGTYDAEGNTIISGGALNPAITPLSWTEALNMIGKLGTATAAEVAKFGLNLNTAPGDINSICEKWEALALAPANDAANPNDYFLFVGNDNDFITATGKYMDATGTLQDYNAGLENDTIVLAWRVRMTGSDNQAPFVANNIPDQIATELSAFSFTFDAGTFADPESTTLTYTATKADDSPLPAWLSFNAGTRTFSGTPSLADVGTLNVKVTATDSGTPALSVSAPFTITVGAAPTSFSFASATYSVVESAGNVTLTINRAGGQGATSINVSTTDGTALAGTDYTAQSNVAVNFAANQASATIDVPVVNRSGINASRSFTAALSGGTTTAPATTTVTITESESSFAFSASTASVSEAAGNVVLTINRTGRTDVANAVSVNTSNGTAIAGTDYTAQSGVAVNFAINDTSKTISIPVINRPGIRPSRTFSAALSVSGSPLLTGTPSSSTVTITEADTFGAMTGPSSSKTPYVQPLLSNWQTTALLSVGDQVTVSANAGSTPLVSGKYEMAGIPDGLGAFDNGDGTFTLLMHHELNNTVGVTRAHGSIGGFISEWIINKSTLQVVSGSDLIRSIYGWNAGTQSSNASPSAAGAFVFNRFCSADLPAPSALYNAVTGLGTQERVFLGGEESGSNGWALATVASGANKGSSYLLGKFNLTTNGSGLTGVGGWENLLASPFAQDKTVVIGNNDGGTGIMSNSVAVYVGTKTNTGTEADKAGLTNGTLKFVNVTGSTAEIVNTTTRATNITSGTAFTLSGTSSTVFSRPEDGAWDPTTPGRFYFVTTDRIDQVADGVGSQIGRTRLWRLNFTDITNPDLGGTIDLVLTGGAGNDANMWDNMCVTADGKLMLQEDVGGAAHNGKVWFYDPATSTLTKVLKHDIARFGDVVSGTVTAATAPFSNDEETSGVIDVTAIFGGNAATGERTYLMVDQAHYSTGLTTAQVEGGQLLLVKQAASFLGVAAGDASSTGATLWAGFNKTTAGAAINVQVATDSAFTSPTTTASSVPASTNGWTTKITVTGLAPATTYFYRFVEVATGEISNTGKFKTAPSITSAAALHFAFSGDNDGLIRPYPLASVVPSQNLDFYINLGDVIYENASNVAGNNGASWLNSPSVTLSNDALNFNGVPRAFIPSGTPFATQAQLFADYTKKYKENFLPVNIGGQNSLKDFYAGQGNYTTWDNHELGNRKYIDGGAPAGGSVGGAAGTDMATGRGVDARDNGAGNVGNVNDVNTSTTDFMNRSTGFQTLRDVFLQWQPIADRGTIAAPADPRTDGSKQLYSAQRWGKNALLINTDTRSYRDIRLKTATANADDTGARADNASRTFLGTTQLAWLKQTLLDAQNSGVVWKFVTLSDPIDQIGPVGGALSLTNLPSFGAGSTYAPVNADGGKAYIGGYRAERNALLKYIADNKISNVVFLSTDDHQNRINEITYSPSGRTGPGTSGFTQSDYIKVPYCFSIVCGPLGATGPDLITNHTFSMAKQLADSIVAAQTTAGVEPLGLVGYPGLKNLVRENDPTAGTSPQAVDFYSPDTFNFTTLDVSADGKTLTVASIGMDATAQNSATEYSSSRTIFSFQIDGVSSNADLGTLALGGGVTLSPAFDPAVTAYTANVAGNVTSMTITPTSSDAGATINVNGNALVSGSATVPLNVGANTITVLVTAADGNTKTYTITVTRAAAPSFAFAASTYSVSESAGNAVLSITRGGDTTVAVSVVVNTANGTGVSGIDYTAVTAQAVNFAANATTATVNVPLLFRSGIQPSRTFTATLSSPSSGTVLGSPTTTTVTITEADTYGAMTGPSSSKTPYVQPLLSNWQTTALLSVGDQVTVSANAGSTPLVSGKYEMAGIPDGLGAFDNGDGTFTLLMHHEINNTLGVIRAHGSIGGFISEWIINKSTLQVVSGSDLIRNIYGWNTGTQSSNASPSAPGAFVFNRFCSADLPAPSALYNAATGLGTQERVFLGGEESGSNGWALATVASGANKGSSYLLGKFNLTTNGSGLTGVGGWENLLASPFAQDKTVVIGNNDGGTGIMSNSVAVYVGTKTNTGTEADKAGLTNGTLKFVNVTGSTAEIVNTTTRATNITSGTPFTLSGTSSTVFSRPEDGAWDPTTPGRFYFVTTDRIDQVNDGVGSQIGRTRLWRLNFTDITNPDLGGTIDLVVTGGVGNDANMWDNMCVTADGKIVLCEDVGGAAHNGKVWFYDPATSTLTKVLKHDIARFGDVVSGTVTAATAPFNNDEETSGVIDVTAIFGGNAAIGNRYYLLVDQAHYTTGITAAQVEGGQLLLVRQTPTSSSLSTTTTPYLLPLDASYSTKSLLAVGDQVTVSANAGSTPLVSGKYEMAGIPDGLGAFDNGDGTLTLLMHHELNNTVGVTRAHGSIGAFISEWIINKSTLQVVSGSDLIRSIYGWNTGTQSSNASPSAPGAFVFNRFCSADLPAPSALYNAATGLGTQERVFLGGEESGSNGWALATVASGANKGSSYLLGKFNLTTNGSGLTGVGGWENLLASPFAQDKTVVIGNNDGGTGIMANTVAVYVGTKTNSGSEADKAGLTNGTLKFVNVTGSTAEIVNTTTRATNITSGTAFTLSGTSSTVFSRPEDGAWDPTTPGRFYFVTTDRIDQVNDGVGSQIGRTRLWRLNFTDITNPDLGGTIDLVLTGGVGNDANMWDNMCVAYDGKVMLQEDVGGAAHNGKIWSYDPVTNTLTKVVTHDPARFGDILAGATVLPATTPFNNDEESSGIIDVTSLLGGNAAAGEHIYFTVCQAHYTTGITAAQVEGGQLLVIRETPRVAFSLAASTNTVNENAGSVALTVNRFGDLQFGGTATVSTLDGTALAGTDYTALSSLVLNFAPGQTSSTITVPILNRQGFGPVSRVFTVGLSAAATGYPSSTRMTINGVPTAQSWRQQYFGTTSGTGTAADDADSDYDGLSNLLEYALGANPTATSNLSSNAPAAVIQDPNALLSDRMSLTFLLDAITPADVTYTVQATDNLLTWTDVASKTAGGSWTWLGGGTSRIVLSNSGGRVLVKVGDSVPTDANHPRRMMRLKVSRP